MMDIFIKFNYYNKLYFYFFDFFHIILNLNLYDKIGITNNININNILINPINLNNINFTLYIDKYDIFQSIRRYLLNQSKYLTFYKLNLLFLEYKKVLDLLNFEDNELLKNVKDKFNKLNNDLIDKLNILKLTYNNKCDLTINNYIYILTNI